MLPKLRPIPRRNRGVTGSKLVAGDLLARETDLEPSGIAGTMRFLDSSDTTLMMTDEQHPYPTTVPCSEKPAKAGTNTMPCYAVG